MAKNHMADVAKMLGLELGEEFKINLCPNELFKFDMNGILAQEQGEASWRSANHGILYELIYGSLEIVKLPWRPKPGEYYYTYNSLWEIINVSWRDDLYDLCWQKLELVFRTEEEALKERSRIYKEWTGEEWEE